VGELSQYPFPVEFVPKSVQIYHGPKKRMQEYLKSFACLKRSRMTEKEFLDYIISTYSEFKNNIQKVKFYKYLYQGMILHFAIVWTRNDALFRDKLFEEGREVTERTGWYPLVTGSRVGRRERAADVHIRESLRKCMNRSKFESTFDLGIPISLEKVGSGSGNAFLMKTSTWNLLFDTGIDPAKLDLNKLDNRKKTIVILSHAHADHVGGLLKIIPNKSFFIIATEITLDLVLNRYDYLHGLDKLLPVNFFYRIFPARFDCVYKFVKGGSLAFFHSSHYPGGVMTLIKFKNGKSFLYTGDFSLSPKYGNETRSMLLQEDSVLWVEANNCIDWALIDAALATKTEIMTFCPEDQLSKGINNSLKENGTTIILIEPQDLGFFLYLDLASQFLVGLGKRRIPFYVDPFIKRLLNTLDKYFKLKRSHSLWPAIQPLLTQRKNIFESVWLYEMDRNWVKNIVYHRSMGSPVLLILDYKRALKDGYGNPVEFQRLVVNSDKIFLVGKSLAQEFQPPASHRKLQAHWGNIELSRDIVLLREDNWLPHCSMSQLEFLLETIKSRLKMIYLFHQCPETLDTVAKTLRMKLKSSIYGLSRTQNLE